ncbi:hypothetical protein GCM10027265_05470 [Jatrophihabitans fulvus]
MAPPIRPGEALGLVVSGSHGQASSSAGEEIVRRPPRALHAKLRTEPGPQSVHNG